MVLNGIKIKENGEIKIIHHNQEILSFLTGKMIMIPIMLELLRKWKMDMFTQLKEIVVMSASKGNILLVAKIFMDMVSIDKLLYFNIH